MARVCEQTERFPDMLEYLTAVLVEKGPELSADERNLFSVACKNLLSSNRTAWRTVIALEPNQKYARYKQSLKEYKEKTEAAILQDCEHVIELIQNNVLTKSVQDEPKAFFAKMAADYNRYICEVTTGDRLETAKSESKRLYEEASSIDMNPCSATKLGLALNLSVFYYEVLKDRITACKYADLALQAALNKIDELGENEFRDAKTVIELMKENLSLWQLEETGGAVNEVSNVDAL